MKSQIDCAPLREWLGEFAPPLVIAGPCSAENENQVIETAKAVSSIPQVKIFRAGIWKPRTRPGTYEGPGNVALSWLQRVKQETNLLVAVEVAQPRHIEKCMKHGINVFWIGARTVVNPFSIQELADALKGVDASVLVKNPVNPDLALWLGAIERINQAGIRNIAAVHRGIVTFEKKLYRNDPYWEMPIELKRLYPNLPVICDPSHISGSREHIQTISQYALDLQMDGLMIETHIDPDNALTDAEQQVTPQQLKKILTALVIRKETGTKESKNELDSLRSKIDKIDQELLNILAKRIRVVEDIGHYKKDNNISILQLKRWRHIFKSRIDHGTELGLNEDFINKLLQLVHEESIAIQAKIMRKEKR